MTTTAAPTTTNAPFDWTSAGTGIASLLTLLGLGGGSPPAAYLGYQGRVPNYTGTRTMNPIPQTVQIPAQAALPAVPAAGFAGQAAIPAYTAPRRPGSGGISYFSPMRFTPVVTTAPEVTTAPGVTTAAVDLRDTSTGGLAGGGIASLGKYSDGGRLLRGPGDGVSDSIPATIGQDGQKAALADGEFVIPARIVSELGNGSTEAGARKLYAMMDRIAKDRRKATNIAANTNAVKHLPA